MERYRNLISILLSSVIIILSIYSVRYLIRSQYARRLQAQGLFLHKSNPGNTNTLNYLNKSLTINPADWRSKWFLAQIYHSHKRYEESEMLLLELLDILDHAEIRLFLFNTYQRKREYDKLLEQGIEIYKRYSFKEENYSKIGLNVNRLIEFKIIKFMSLGDTEGLMAFLDRLLLVNYEDLPFEHFRGIKYALEADCINAVRYYRNFRNNFENNQLLIIFAFCLEQIDASRDKSAGYNSKYISRLPPTRLKVPFGKRNKDPLSRFLVDFYERCNE